MKALISKRSVLSVLLLLIALSGLLIVIRGTRTISLQDDLMKAAQDGNIAELNSILATEVDPNMRFEGDVTPLHLAAGNGHYDCVKSLLQHGAKPNVKDYEGRTAIDMAATKEIRSLLEP